MPFSQGNKPFPLFCTVAEAKKIIDQVMTWGEEYQNTRIFILTWEDAEEIGRIAANRIFPIDEED